jgi:hypothetical protein
MKTTHHYTATAFESGPESLKLRLSPDRALDAFQIAIECQKNQPVEFNGEQFTSDGAILTFITGDAFIEVEIFKQTNPANN